MLRAQQGEWSGEPCQMFLLVPHQQWPRGDGTLGTFVFGAFRLDLACRTVMYRRDYVPVSEMEFRLLAHLCRHPDRVLTKADLLRAVWSVRSQATRVLDVTINRVRRKLADVGCPGDTIKTLHGHGYAFMPGRLFT